MARRVLTGSGALLAAWLASGCGISLDLDPQAPLPVAGMDAGEGRADAGARDAARFDSADPGDDAAAAEAGMGTPDGAVSSDAGPSSCPATPCDLVLQCGCTDGTLPTCDVNGVTLRTECRAAGSTPRDSECMFSDECAAGLTCLEMDGLLSPSVGTGVCTTFCAEDSSCGGAGGVCVPVFETAGACTTGCDPVHPGGECPGSLDCVFDDYWMGTYCRAGSGVAGVGEACVTSLECNPGTVCEGTPGLSTCKQLCYMDSDCSGGATGACAFMWSLGSRGSLGVCPSL